MMVIKNLGEKMPLQILRYGRWGPQPDTCVVYFRPTKKPLQAVITFLKEKKVLAKRPPQRIGVGGSPEVREYLLTMIRNDLRTLGFSCQIIKQGPLYVIYQLDSKS